MGARLRTAIVTSGTCAAARPQPDYCAHGCGCGSFGDGVHGPRHTRRLGPSTRGERGSAPRSPVQPAEASSPPPGLLGQDRFEDRDGGVLVDQVGAGVAVGADPNVGVSEGRRHRRDPDAARPWWVVQPCRGFRSGTLRRAAGSRARRSASSMPRDPPVRPSPRPPGNRAAGSVRPCRGEPSRRRRSRRARVAGGAPRPGGRRAAAIARRRQCSPGARRAPGRAWGQRLEAVRCLPPFTRPEPGIDVPFSDRVAGSTTPRCPGCGPSIVDGGGRIDLGDGRRPGGPSRAGAAVPERLSRIKSFE